MAVKDRIGSVLLVQSSFGTVRCVRSGRGSRGVAERGWREEVCLGSSGEMWSVIASWVGFWQSRSGVARCVRVCFDTVS